MDEHLKRGLQKIYRFLIQYDIVIFIVLISLVFCIIADGTPEFRMYKTLRDYFAKQCPVEYVWLWERLCGPQIDYAAISAFILAVWAASLSLIGVFLGRTESKLYGIKVMDIFLENYSYTKVFLLLFTFVAELIAVMLAIMYEWEMTLIVSAMLQVLILIYILLIVFIENSVSNVEGVIKELAQEAIKREKKEEFVLDWAMEKVIKNIDYKDEREMLRFYNVFRDILETCVRDKSFAESNIQQYVKVCADKFIRQCGNRNISAYFVKILLMDMDNICVQRGVMEAVFGNVSQRETPEVIDILEIKFPNRTDILIWGIAYNGCYSMCHQQQYRLFIVKELMSCLKLPLSENDKKKLYKYWECFISVNKSLILHKGELHEAVEKEIKGQKLYEELEDLRLDILWEIIG